MTVDYLSRRRMLTLSGGAATVALAGCLGGDEDDPGVTDDHGDEDHTGVEAEREAYVVTYHWGYAVFDEHGDELDQIEIAPGTELTIHAVNDHAYDAFEALPDPVAEQLDDFDALARTEEKVEAGEFPEPEDATVEGVYDEAHGRGGDDDHDDGHSHSVSRELEIEFLHDEDDDGHDDDDHGHDDDDHGHDDDGHDDDDHDDDDHGHDDDDHDDDDHGHDDDDHDHDHEDAKLDHGFMIVDTDIMLDVPADKDEPVTGSVVFDEPGTYEAMCQIDCGYYHTEQVEELIVVTEE
ncbi:hypothetical protein OB919_10240 [Halobacteria archaeon AArc-curdl1]|uniref:Uncharacterized protein n=1 Tax=Natronosalvus hydrolyticus TaxID=2979988 RepID=A0AAP2Z873_9EURY|nr:hypothetical protein [Halobacteria archaeon AArc-curdl1]